MALQNPTKFVMKQKTADGFIQLLPKTVIDQVYETVNSNGSNLNPLWSYLNNRYTSVTAENETGLNNNTFVNIKAVTATDATNHTKTVALTSSLKTKAIADATSTSDGLATAYDVQTYVGSFAGGITYKGTLDWENGSDDAGSTTRKTLPTTGVKTGDLWIVAKATDVTHKYDDKSAEVGDFFIASVDGTTSPATITWQLIPINFTVEDKKANIAVSLTEPAEANKTVIAVVDGKKITMSVTADAANVTYADSESRYVAGTVANALTEVAREIDNMDFTKTNAGTNITTSITQVDGKITDFTHSERYATVVSSKTGEADTVITVTNPSQLIIGSDAKILATFTNTRIAEEVAKLDADITSSEAAVATVEVKEVDGKITDVVVTNIQSGTSWSNVTEGTDKGPKLTATTATGAVTGGDIAAIDGYVKARTKYDIEQLDVNSYAQATYDTTNSKFVISGIKEVDGKIAEGTTKNFDIVTEGTYNASTNKVATQSTVSDAVNALDVTGYAQAIITNVDSTSLTGGSIAVKGIKEVDGKISSTGTNVTLTAEAGLRIYGDKIGHTNATTAQTNLGSVADSESKVLTGVSYDAQGHFTGATVTEIKAQNIKNVSSGNLSATNVQAALNELQGDIDSIIAGTQFKGEFTSNSDWATKTATKSKVGDTYVYTSSTTITLLTKTVEQGDIVIVSKINDVKTPTAIVVVERSLDHAVTNPSGASLQANHIVLGNSNDTVKTSEFTIRKTAVVVGSAGADNEILTSAAVNGTITNRLSQLDATVTHDSTNVNVTVVETDGKLTSVTVSEDYATITRTAKSGSYGATGYVAPNYVVTSGSEGKLVKASDLANLKLYADDKVAEEIEKLDATVTSDSTNVNVTITETNGKLTGLTVTQDYATVTYTANTGTTAPTYVVTTGDEGKLIKASDAANLKSYVDRKVESTVLGLDATVSQTATNDNGSLQITVVESNGVLTSVSGSVKKASADSYGVVKVASTVATGNVVSNVLQDSGVLKAGDAKLTVKRVNDGGGTDSNSSFTANALADQTYTFKASFITVAVDEPEDLANGDFWFDIKTNE